MSIRRPIVGWRAPAGVVPAAVGVVLAAACVLSAPGAVRAQAPAPDHHVPSTPENVVWGWFPIDREPVLTVRSGDTVRVDTLSHAGATQAEDPERYLGQFGV
ncbi:MAG: hypothetical protein OXH69_07095, partial [Acidobacteria bacterium]|nr:hypothetical protein [Acidobacteriota bacterium]